MSKPTRHVVGCMTGTSLDGLDAALTRIDGQGLDMRAAFVRMASRPFDDQLRQTLRSLASAEPHPAEDFARAARALGALHADVVAELIGNDRIDFVAAHGQTIFHAGDAHLSWQLFDPWPIVHRLHVPVCYDLRQADLVAGGRGAPITPIADWVMYRGQADAVVNLGGVANVTSLHEDVAKIAGADVGPCNLLIDGLCHRLFNEPCDRDGRLSASGKPVTNLLAIVSDAVFAAQEQSATLGREQFDDRWFDGLLEQLPAEASPADVLCSAIGVAANAIITSTVGWRPRTVALAGGGARNPTLTRAIRNQHKGDVLISDELGIPCEAREAMGFAVLGVLSQDGVSITLPQVTGAKLPGVAGAWVYPCSP